MDNKLTALCKLAYKYGTDKCPQIKHSYTPFYYKLLKARRKSIKKVLELGVGLCEGRPVKKGASLYMWREFFPNAQIYGADIRPKTIFQDERIKTYLCDERIKEDLVKLIENTGPDIDLFIDDGSHHVDDQIFLAETLLPLLQRNVTYIIEDVTHSKVILRALGDKYNYDLPAIPRKWHDGKLLVINKQNGIK